MLPEISTWFFPPATPIQLQNAYINDKHLESAFFTSMEHLKLGKDARVFEPKYPTLFLFVFGLVSRNYKTKKLLLLPCMYRYIFSFTLRLITTLLQKLAIFHICNVKQKDDGIGQNTLYCCYDEYVTTYQQP